MSRRHLYDMLEGLKCNETNCDGTHTKLKKRKKEKRGVNPYLKFALSNSMGRRFAQEKVQNQLVQNEFDIVKHHYIVKYPGPGGPDLVITLSHSGILHAQ